MTAISRTDNLKLLASTHHLAPPPPYTHSLTPLCPKSYALSLAKANPIRPLIRSGNLLKALYQDSVPKFCWERALDTSWLSGESRAVDIQESQKS